MSKCGKCGAQIKDNVKYCKSCGSKSFDDKKARVMAREKSWVKPVVLAAAVVLVVIAAWFFQASRGDNMSDAAQFATNDNPTARFAKALKVTVENGEIRIPVSKVEDGKAHFFAHTVGPKTVTFIVIKAADGSIRTAFDACYACNHAKLGYREEGGSLVCNNCGLGYKPNDIGKRNGGCSPIAVNKSIDGQMIVLKAADLEAGAQYF